MLSAAVIAAHPRFMGFAGLRNGAARHGYHGPMRILTIFSSHHTWCGLLLSLLAAASQAQSATPSPPAWLQAVNAVRQQGCEGPPAKAAALRENPVLSRAAAQVAAGSQLDDALRVAGYRATIAAQIGLRGYLGPAALTPRALGHTCSAVTQIELSEAGFFLRGKQAWIVLAAPFSPPDVAEASELQVRDLELVNHARASPRRCGQEAFQAARPLRLNPSLRSIAAAHAADMARYSYFSHTGRDGSQVGDRASRGGYRWRVVGENIAAGQQQADAAVQGWLDSPGHCANIMSPAYTEMGLAFAVNKTSSAGIYWAQVFGATR